MYSSKSEKHYSLCFLFFKVWQGENCKHRRIIPRIQYHFVDFDGSYQFEKNYANPWEISTYQYGCNNTNTKWYWYWYWYQHNPREALFVKNVDIP